MRFGKIAVIHLSAMLAVVGRHRHRGGPFGIIVLVIVVAVLAVLLVQRRRERSGIAESAPGAALAHVKLAMSDTNTGDFDTAGGRLAWAPMPMPPGRYGLSGLLRSEWTKLRSVRSTGWTLAITVVLGIGVSVIVTAETRAHWSTTDHQGFDPISTSLIGVFIGQFAVGVLGVLVMSSEYGTGTIRSTLAAAPRRPLVLSAKVLVFGAVALVVGEVVAFVAFFVGQALLSAPAVHASLSTPGAWRAVVGSGLYIAVLGLFSLGLATVIRHTAGAISAFVGILLVLPLVVAALPSSLQSDVRRFLPDRIGSELINGNGFGFPGAFSPWIGFLIMCGYTAALLVAGGVLMVRRDA